MAIVGLLELGWRDIPAGAVKPLGVVPVNPRRGCELELPERSPALPPADQLGFVETVDGLGQGVVVAVALAPDAVDGLGLIEALGVANRKVLNPAIGMVDQTGQLLTPEGERHLEGVERENRSAGSPTSASRRCGGRRHR